MRGLFVLFTIKKKKKKESFLQANIKSQSKVKSKNTKAIPLYIAPYMAMSRRLVLVLYRTAK